jgi:hypothetical protein
MISFMHENTKFELYSDEEGVEIYCKRTEISGFAKWCDRATVEVDVPFNPTFRVSRKMVGKHAGEITVVVDIPKALVISEKP